MSSPQYSKQKGYIGEAEFVQACHEVGFDPDPESGVRRYGNVQGQDDKGDIAGIYGWTIQCKSVERLTLPEFLRKTEEQRVRANNRYGGLAVKLKGRHMRDGCLILPMHVGLHVVKVLPSLEDWFTEEA
jgi:hypothetical protein